jgi:predicted ABC-type ATPase
MGALDDLTLKLAAVKAYERTTKTGKQVQVGSYVNKVQAAAAAAANKAATGVSAGKGTFTRPNLVPAADPKTTRPNSAKPTTRLVAGLRTTPMVGHDAKRLEKAGHPGASLAEANAARQHMGGHQPMSDEEYSKHTAMIEKKIGQAIKDGKATDVSHAINADKGIWKPERAKMHKEIVNEIMKNASGAKSEGKAIIAGGLGGAGKSTMLAKHPDINPKHYVTVNPDDIKEHLAKRGMIPDVKGLSPMERASLVHEESSHIANLVGKRAMAEKKNLIWDITMASHGSTKRRVDELRNHGYKHVKGMFVDVPVETSVARALGRHRKGMEAERQGTPGALGGRYVPPSIIRANKSDKSSSANRDTFEAMKHHFDSWELHDSSGNDGPQLKEKSDTRKRVA